MNTSHKIKIPFLFLFFLQFSISIWGQHTVADLIKNAAAEGKSFPEQVLFEQTGTLDDSAAVFARDAQFLLLNEALLNTLMTQDLPTIQLLVPYHGTLIRVDLVQVTVMTKDFKSVSSDQDKVVQVKPGKHYRGIIHNDESSLAAISFFDGDIMGFISNERNGNLVLGKLHTPNNTKGYIVYEDRKLTTQLPFNCETAEPDEDALIPSEVASRNSSANQCVRSFLEIDNRLYVHFGSMQATINFVTGLYNQVATIYANEQVVTVISEIYVWVTPDNYNYNVQVSAQVLGQFLHNRIYYNGDAAHLLGLGLFGNLGGIASSIGAYCGDSYKHTFNHIFPFYSNVPTYSWSVGVFAHELGHLIGSHHTHWCGWAGGPIDGCGPAGGFPYEQTVPSSSCPPAPIPPNGGTVMSYCHLLPQGINFSFGFGPQPGDAIRNAYSNAACLKDNCCLVDAFANPSCTSCPAVPFIELINVGQDNITLTWNPVPGALSYTVFYRLLGDEPWTPVGVITPSIFVVPTNGPLPCGTLLEFAVQSNCDNDKSVLSNGVIAQLRACVPACPAPNPLNTSVTQTSVTFTWGGPAIGGGGVNYRIRYRPVATNVWVEAITNANTFTFNGLTPSTSYIGQVSAICGANISSIKTKLFGTASPPVCNIPNNLSVTPLNGTSAKAMWSGASGAISYTLEYKLVSSSTWQSTSVSAVMYTITGLTPTATYEARVRSECFGGTLSNFSAPVSFTQPINMISDGHGGIVFMQDDNTPTNTLTIVPNPTHQTATVYYSVPREAHANLQLIGFLGEVVMNTQVPADEHVIALDLSAQSAGVYWIKLLSDNGQVEVKKIIKL